MLLVHEKPRRLGAVGMREKARPGLVEPILDVPIVARKSNPSLKAFTWFLNFFFFNYFQNKKVEPLYLSFLFLFFLK